MHSGRVDVANYCFDTVACTTHTIPSVLPHHHQASNREAARRSRERKNLLINELLQEVGLLEQENESLATEVGVLGNVVGVQCVVGVQDNVCG